jgi:hypothetical protein
MAWEAGDKWLGFAQGGRERFSERGREAFIGEAAAAIQFGEPMT